MNVTIEKSVARGKISAPPSKSMAHRLLIAAALANGESIVRGISECEDVLATIDCLCALGANITLSGDTAYIKGFDPMTAIQKSDASARESGSTLRFMIPIALLGGHAVRFTGAARLLERPMSPYEDLCRESGMSFVRERGGITVCGPLGKRDFYLPGNISSQFITGILFTLPLLGGDRRIYITTELESRSYIDLTISAMRTFGVDVLWESESVLLVRDGSSYSPREVSVEGDYSGTAFIEAFNLFGGEVEVSGLYENSLQGDRVYREYFKSLASGCPELSLANCPDLAPILFVCAAALNGAHFTSTARLKIKESDRAQVMAQELSKFGAKLIVGENDVTVKKAALHAPAEMLSGHNDHRIVMSLSVLATIYGGEIEGAEAISKSYTTFFDDIEKLGIKVKKNET